MLLVPGRVNTFRFSGLPAVKGWPQGIAPTAIDTYLLNAHR
jgi:hypothetical protein